ncbi:MAG: hypothetical protein R3Y54_01585 [Eubacteriales bacterium]
MKKIQLFYKIIMGYCLLLACLCFYGWYQIGEFANGLEMTLQVNASSVNHSGTENTSSKENSSYMEHTVPNDSSLWEQDKPSIVNEDYLLLDVEEHSKIWDISLEIAEKYAKFTSGDADFKEIKSYFMEGSDILTALESYSSRRYDDHDEVFIEDMECESLYDMGNGQLVSRVTFVYLVQVGEEVKRFPSDYSIYFDEESGKIIALSMN